MDHSPVDDNRPPLPQPAKPLSMEFTVLLSADPLTKTYDISDGAPQVSRHPSLSRGLAQRVNIEADAFVAQFAELLVGLDFELTHRSGAMSDSVLGDIANITTRDRHRPDVAGDGSPLIWRGKDWLGYKAEKPAILGLDSDAKGMPADLRRRVEERGGVLSILQSICPALAQYGLRVSTQDFCRHRHGGYGDDINGRRMAL